MIPVCCGSDEEQARTAAEDATESYVIHTEFCSKVKERKMRNNTQNFTWFTLSKATSTGGKTKRFLLLMQYRSGSVLKYRAFWSYIGRGQNKKNNRITFHMDLGHSPIIHHLELTSI